MANDYPLIRSSLRLAPSRTATVWRVVGRSGLASMFVLAGVYKLIHFPTQAALVASEGIPAPLLMLSVAIILEIGGGVMVLMGGRSAVTSAWLLAAFTLLVNLLFHDFWAMTGGGVAAEVSLFFKNIAVAGALLYVAVMEKERAQVQ